LNAHFDGKTEIYMSQHRVLTKDGTYKWIFDRGKIIERDDENKPLRVIGTHTDISQLIETQEKLKESENRLKNIIDAAGEYIWESDLQNRYTFVSDRFTKILGYSQKEVIGKTPYDFMPDVEKKNYKNNFFW
jgi:PAS domain-containing protein